MRKLLIIAFWSAAAFAFIMAVLPQPPRLPSNPPDKIQHIIAFATLAALGTAAYPKLAWHKLLLGLCAFGAAIEIAQAIPTLHRDADVRDWFADTLAVVTVLTLMTIAKGLGRARRDR